MHYRLLGPLQVEYDGRGIDIGPPKQRAVLAALLLARGAVVSTDALIDAVWGDDVPGSATVSLQAYISNLRKALRAHEGAPAAIVRQAPGYYLNADSVDLCSFGDHCADARAAVADARWRDALDSAEAALALWRGPLLTDFRDEAWVAAESVRVDELHDECRENRVTALLALGRNAEAVTASARLREADPLRERACWLHMLALYRVGRGPEALEAYAAHARALDVELGLRPGRELNDLQTAILRQSPELDAWPRSPAWTGAEGIASPSAQVATVVEVAERTPPVGRERELAVLAKVLGEVSAGAARWLVLTGPPGIGKTRIAEEAAAAAGASGHQVVWVNCPDERGVPPWWSMRHLVRALGADEGGIFDTPADSDPDSARFVVYERINALLRDQPALTVVVDDAQWADAASASCLAYLAGALRDCRVAMVLTVRDGEYDVELSRLLSTVARGDGNRRVNVPALTPADVATLANEIAESPEDLLTPAEADVLADRTGGNPFFVTEYARLPRQERDSGDIPSAIKSVLDRRLSGLDSAVLQVLRAAAVIAETLDGPAVTTLGATTRLDIDELADYLDEAADARILISAHDGSGYEFAHGLLREHLLVSMPVLRRQRLHAKVAEVLATNSSHDAVSQRAQHLIAAGPLVDPADVVAACRLAAQQATDQWSSDIAARWWQAALDAYDLLPASERDDVQRDGLTAELLEAWGRAGRGQTVLDAAAAGLREALSAGRAATAGRVSGALLRVSGGWPWLAPGADPTELLALLEQAAGLTANDPAAGARVRAALAVGNCYNPDPQVSAGLLAAATTMAADSADREVIADALLAHLITYSGVGVRSVEVLGWAQELIALPHNRILEDQVIAHSVATMAAMNLGDVSGTERHLRAGIAGSEKLRLPVLRAQLRWMEAVLAAWRGDFTEAHRQHAIATRVHEQTELYEAGSGLIAATALLRETGERPDETTLFGGDPDRGGEGMIDVARAALLTVYAREADRQVAEQVVARRSAPTHVWTSLGQATLYAHLVADYRLAQHAPALLDELTPYRERIAGIGQVGVVGPVALATARLHAVLGDATAARADLLTARELAQRTGALPTLLRCRLLDCELDMADGADRTQAIAELAVEAESLGMAGLAQRALRLV